MEDSEFIVITIEDANCAVYESIATCIQSKLRRDISNLSPCEVVQMLAGAQDRKHKVIKNMYTLYTCARVVAPVAYTLLRMAI